MMVWLKLLASISLYIYKSKLYLQFKSSSILEPKTLSRNQKKRAKKRALNLEKNMIKASKKQKVEKAPETEECTKLYCMLLWIKINPFVFLVEDSDQIEESDEEEQQHLDSEEEGEDSAIVEDEEDDDDLELDKDEFSDDDDDSDDEDLVSKSKKLAEEESQRE